MVKLNYVCSTSAAFNYLRHFTGPKVDRSFFLPPKSSLLLQTDLSASLQPKELCELCRESVTFASSSHEADPLHPGLVLFRHSFNFISFSLTDQEIPESGFPLG